MTLSEVVYYGLPRGIDKPAALVILLINVIAPGVGTIISAYLGASMENETICAGVAHALTSPILGLGFIWAIAWSIRLYRSADPAEPSERSALLDSAPADVETAPEQQTSDRPKPTASD